MDRKEIDNWSIPDVSLVVIIAARSSFLLASRFLFDLWIGMPCLGGVDGMSCNIVMGLDWLAGMDGWMDGCAVVSMLCIHTFTLNDYNKKITFLGMARWSSLELVDQMEFDMLACLLEVIFPSLWVLRSPVFS
jgi:hypothetical protein